MPNAHIDVIDNIVRYNGRLPVNRIRTITVILAKLFTRLKITAALSGSIGLPYALKICIQNFCIPDMPENSAIKNIDNTMKSGLSVRFRLNSDNFSSIVGTG